VPEATVIRPTMKFVNATYVAVLLVIIAVAGATLFFLWPAPIAWVSPLLLLWPLKLHIENKLTRVTIQGGKLLFETGFFNRTTRSIVLERIQDLTVRQSLGQRILGVGDLSIETAGESSRLTIPRIDRPQDVANLLNDLAHRG